MISRRLRVGAVAGFLCLQGLAVPAGGAPKAPGKGTQKEAEKEASTGEEWTTSESAADGRPRDPELGDPPTAPEGDEDARPSPLTPPPREMPPRPSVDAADDPNLLGELVALRARVNALTRALYESRLRIVLDVDGEDARIASVSVTVDGGVVYTAPARFVGADGLLVYEHAVAPGKHVIGVEVERFDPRSKQHRSLQYTRYAVEVPEKKTLSARIELDDASSPGDGKSGRYRPRSWMRFEVVDR